MTALDDLFQRYAATPRHAELGPSVHAAAATGARWVGYTALGGLAFGLLLSLLPGHRNLVTSAVAGLGMAAVAMPIALIPFLLLRSYVKIFRDGRLVEGVSVELRQGGTVFRVAAGPGPDLTFVGDVRVAVGQRVPFLVGDAMSSRALCVARHGDVRRCTLLTQTQLAQVAPS